MVDEIFRPIICVVDDEQSLLSSYCALLSSAEFAPVPYTTGRDLLSDDKLGAASCVLLDLWMPPPDGLETLRQIVARDNPPPVIMITGHGDIPLAVAAIKLGAADFLEKPVDDDELIRLIENLIANRAAQTSRSVSSAPPLQGDAATALKRLTSREREIVDLLIKGRTNKEIARDLGISYRTVEAHRARIMDKTRAESFSHLIRMAVA